MPNNKYTKIEWSCMKTNMQQHKSQHKQYRTYDHEMCECVQLKSLHIKSQNQVVTFHEALEIHNEERIFKPKLPLQEWTPLRFCQRNKPINKEALTISPFGYFVTKSTLTIILTKTKENWSTKFSTLQLSPSLSLEHLQVISKLVENSNLHTINKKYTLQEQVCERCLIKKEFQSINVIMQCNATPPHCINSQHG